MAFKQVLPGIFEMFLPLPMKPTIINAWLIDCGGGEWAMVDTGMNLPESYIVMEDAFLQVGARFEDLKVLIGTVLLLIGKPWLSKNGRDSGRSLIGPILPKNNIRFARSASNLCRYAFA